MTASDLLHQPVAQAIAWALLQFVWQGALIGVICAVAFAALRRSAADVRYVVGAIGLTLMLTLPAVTALQTWRSANRGTPARTEAITSPSIEVPEKRQVLPTVQRSPMVDGSGTATVGEDRVSGPQPRPVVEPWLPFMLAVWLAGVAVLSLRLVSSWFWVQGMKRHRAVPAVARWQEMATRLCRSLHITRSVQLLESAGVEVPTVIGWLKPVVLLPTSAVAGLAPQQLEAILAHELAHIRRHDYLVNLLQTLVETLLFYHPAVWWLSRRVRIERENCCDDIAVSLCGDPYTYAQALASLEELRGGARHFALAASGGSLLQRVRRLLGVPHAGSEPAWFAGAAMLLMAAIAAAVVGQDIVASGQSPDARHRAAEAAAAVAASSDRQRAVMAAEQAKALAAAEAAQHAQQQAMAAALADADQALSAHEAARQMAVTAATNGDLFAEQARALAEADAKLAEHAKVLAESSDVLATLPLELEKAQAALAALPDIGPMTAAAGELLSQTEPAFAALAKASEALAATGGSGSAQRKGRSSGNFSWSNGRDKLEVKYEGDIEFTDDDTDVKSMSPDGYLRIKDGSVPGGRTIEFSADASGNVQRRFWVGSTEKQFDPEGRQWLAQALPRFIRQTGIGAKGRVARILKAKGPSGVLAEISLIEGSWAKRVYFTELLNSGTLDSPALRQTVAQAGRELDSDFERASLLIDSADRFLGGDEAIRQAYFDAARGIKSDFEMHRVYASALKRGRVSPAILASILDASTAIDSDFEEASFLVQVAQLQPLDNTTRGPFFAALKTVSSDFEHHRVLTALGQQPDLGAETTKMMLESAATIGSDFEIASFLVDLAKRRNVDGDLRQPFFSAAGSIDSAFERGRVLKTVAARSDLPGESLLDVLRSVKTMNGNFEASQVLIEVARTHTLTGQARELYVDAAERLGDFEQGQVMTALVKNERRK
ncbi:MAG TPA: M56 family metallopeptidase [Vicinamibacterales bacterium]|nr:M56 family metallopeptidase [Vicinamibacterales bacterium]